MTPVTAPALVCAGLLSVLIVPAIVLGLLRSAPAVSRVNTARDLPKLTPSAVQIQQGSGVARQGSGVALWRCPPLVAQVGWSKPYRWIHLGQPLITAFPHY